MHMANLLIACINFQRMNVVFRSKWATEWIKTQSVHYLLLPKKCYHITFLACLVCLPGGLYIYILPMLFLFNSPFGDQLSQNELDHIFAKFSGLEGIWVRIISMKFVSQLLEGYFYGNQKLTSSFFTLVLLIGLEDHSADGHRNMTWMAVGFIT